MNSFLKLTILNDNQPGLELRNDWGWSVLLESEEWSILFDADTKPDILEYNSKKLHLDLSTLDFAFLSHYHADHYGGFSYIGKIAPGLKIYVPYKTYNFLKEWGVDPIEIRDSFEITENVWSSGPMGFIKEQALGIKVESLGIIVIVGCSHPGVDKFAKKLSNILHGSIYAVIGGFHSPSTPILDNLAKISQYIAPAHCSSSAAKRYIKKKYPKKYIDVKTGSIFIFK